MSMPGSAPSVVSQLLSLIEQVKLEQRQEIRRAIVLRQDDRVKAAYHAGLADGRNNIIAELRRILNNAAIAKGGNASARQSVVSDKVFPIPDHSEYQ